MRLKMRVFGAFMLSPMSLLFVWTASLAQATDAVSEERENGFPVVGMSIAAPGPDGLQAFLTFMREELATIGVNTLLLRVDFRYEYESYPNLRSEGALSREQVKEIVKVARESGIRLIPQINLLGHQSWHSELGNLLREYPEFDETPSIELPPEGTYEWPNKDGLYCKSYCPLHPDVHAVVFAVVDELVEAFEADAFHPGLDEVFYIGHEDCPRCRGKDKAQLFAGEVNRIYEHLAENEIEMWMWGDRLLDGKTTGIGMWEASENDTFHAIDMIPKEIVICDWHYERADPTAAYFAAKGSRVVTCSWNNAEVVREQVNMMAGFRRNSTPVMRDRFLGMMHTVWSPASRYLAAVSGETQEEGMQNQVECFEAMVEAIDSPNQKEEK